MLTFVLYGKYRRKYGKEFTLAVDNIQHGMRLLAANFGDFMGEVREDHFHVWVGKPTKGINIDDSLVEFVLPKDEKIHIIPAIKGQGNNNIAKALGMILAGAALFAIGGGWFGPAVAGKFGSMMSNLGISLMLGGAAALLSPQQKTPKDKEEDSFMFSGSTNVYAQGVGLPVVYGEVICGSVTAAGAIKTVDIPVDGDDEEDEDYRQAKGRLIRRIDGCTLSRKILTYDVDSDSALPQGQRFDFTYHQQTVTENNSTYTRRWWKCDVWRKTAAGAYVKIHDDLDCVRFLTYDPDDFNYATNPNPNPDRQVIVLFNPVNSGDVWLRITITDAEVLPFSLTITRPVKPPKAEANQNVGYTVPPGEVY